MEQHLTQKLYVGLSFHLKPICMLMAGLGSALIWMWRSNRLKHFSLTLQGCRCVICHHTASVEASCFLYHELGKLSLPHSENYSLSINVSPCLSGVHAVHTGSGHTSNYSSPACMQYLSLAVCYINTICKAVGDHLGCQGCQCCTGDCFYSDSWFACLFSRQ